MTTAFLQREEVVGDLVEHFDAEIVAERDHADLTGELDWMLADALARGDEDAVLRLRRLVALVSAEVEYAAGIRRGLPLARRRTDAPKGAIAGWWIRHDAATRTIRRTLGLWIPDDEVQP
jgi:hypothetical protein